MRTAVTFSQKTGVCFVLNRLWRGGGTNHWYLALFADCPSSRSSLRRVLMLKTRPHLLPAFPASADGADCLRKATGHGAYAHMRTIQYLARLAYFRPSY